MVWHLWTHQVSHEVPCLTVMMRRYFRLHHSGGWMRALIRTTGCSRGEMWTDLNFSSPGDNILSHMSISLRWSRLLFLSSDFIRLMTRLLVLPLSIAIHCCLPHPVACKQWLAWFAFLSRSARTRCSILDSSSQRRSLIWTRDESTRRLFEKPSKFREKFSLQNCSPKWSMLSLGSPLNGYLLSYRSIAWAFIQVRELLYFQIF